MTSRMTPRHAFANAHSTEHARVAMTRLDSTERGSAPPQLLDRVAVLPGRLDYALVDAAGLAPATVQSWRSATEQFLCVDDELVYARFFADFGPLNLAQTVRFCRAVDANLCDASVESSRAKTLVVVSSDHPHKRANAMALLTLYLVVRAEQSPEQAVAWFRALAPPFVFRDAACGICTFFITVLDCARAVYKAMTTSIWSFESFSLENYEHLDVLHNGDINWIVPGKLLAFSGPQRERVVLDAQHNRTTMLAHEYARVFRDLGVSCVVRFNEPSTYDRKAFAHAGIQHLDLEYPDGGNPPDAIINKFLHMCERESGAVAVHCKAGLGRTGTNIAAYLIKNHRFSAVEAIAWCRICRPGSIVGPQQQFLLVKQRELWALTPFDGAAASRAAKTHSTHSMPQSRFAPEHEMIAPDAPCDKRTRTRSSTVVTRRSLAPLKLQSAPRASPPAHTTPPSLQLMTVRTAAALRGR